MQKSLIKDRFATAVASALVLVTISSTSVLAAETQIDNSLSSSSTCKSLTITISSTDTSSSSSSSSECQSVTIGIQPLAPEPANRPKASSRKMLFVFLRGIGSDLEPDQAAANNGDGSDSKFFKTGNLGTYLQSQGYPNARYLVYSYAPSGFTATGQPRPYTCENTHNQLLASHILRLSRQIYFAAQNQPNTDIYLIAHSMGGIIAFGYLASLLERVGNVTSLPRNGSALKGIVTLDSPLGGVTSDSDYKKFVFLRSLPCQGLAAGNSVAIAQMQALFQTATSSTARGATASIVKAIFNGKYIPNQKVANDAKQAGITVLTIGNANDLLWRPSMCNETLKDIFEEDMNMQDFSSTQWLQDQGTNSRVYSRTFTSGFPSCLLGLANSANHSDVFRSLAVKQAVVQMVNGTTPSSLLPASKTA